MPIFLALIAVEIAILIALCRKPHVYSVVVKELSMPIGVVTPGTPASFQAVLNDNGAPITLPAGSTWNWTVDDTTATVTPSNDTVSITLPASDTATTVTVKASTTAPDGTTVEGQVVVQVQPGNQPGRFTVTVTQTS